METAFFLHTANQVLGAGIAITALSLFLRALSFSLSDKVSRSFALILASLMLIFSGEAISNAIVGDEIVSFWIKFHWTGLVFFPAAITQFGDAILETTGRPSRGRRHKVIVLAYILSWSYFLLIIFDILLGDLAFTSGGYVYPSPTPYSISFSIYFFLAMIASGIWIYRAFKRTRLPVSKTRIKTLFSAVLFMAIGTYPYLQVGSAPASSFPVFFGVIVALGNIPIFLFLISMAYALGFFGVPWPDRIIKSRLLKWLLRGPFTVFIVLALMTGINELGQFYGTPNEVAIPIVTSISVLFIEHLITLIFPTIERWFFHGGEQENMKLIHSLSEKMITKQDLKQFLEAIVAAICDKFEVTSGFVASIGENGINQIVEVGKSFEIIDNKSEKTLVESVTHQFRNEGTSVFSWSGFWIYPLFNQEREIVLGLIGVLQRDDHNLLDGLADSLSVMGEKAALALEDRKIQQQIFDAIQTLQPKVDFIQQMRAASRYDQKLVFDQFDKLESNGDVSQWVRDALTHYWGGPKLTENPLMNLKVVRYATGDYEGNPVNALRGILKKAVEKVKPEGERRFTADWILYNILELKFFEGRKVREVALRLAMSEADLYRKQRVAIEAVAEAVIEMESSLEE
jgi:hypothetical protein